MSAPSVVPLPSSMTATGGAPFRLDGAVLTGDEAAVTELRRLLHLRTGLHLPVDPGSGAVPEGRRIDLRIGALPDPESSVIAIDADGVWVEGADPAGLFYAVQTLAQLATASGSRGELPALRIQDVPRFAYRGVMLDVARHFHDVRTVEAFIERAASLKFNHLHLHLSDDQGWRIALDTRPLLAERASGTSIGGDPGGHFSRDDYQRIVAAAAARHMVVVPEIDLPGHTHAVGLAYPELCEDPVITDEVRATVRDFGGDLPRPGEPYTGLAVGFSSLRIRDEGTYAFVADVVGELATITPGPYLHVGGDEALGTPADDFALFMERVTAIVVAQGKTPVTWHEAGAAPGLAPGTIGQYWGFVEPIEGMDEKTRAFVARGGRVILSPADAIYLDMKFAADSPLGLTWARGVTTLERAYDWEPAEVIPGVGDEQILGVEAALWTETVRDLADIDALLFPRIAAAAEAAWSPPRGSTPERSWASFRERVEALPSLWAALGFAGTSPDSILDREGTA
ncbi:beta-N-acetylhexosaminidase [Microbacterium sp. TNHR37B]|uniref:beta-N-acetylhexosaminidase n=1 Tax=Microbacterium sp. TNHR37B TaxID=1775956 RepID=UPI0007B2636C|nr:beta-N-acetylhexosaminidase [Microbacterium sp. TNHR37B]KZE89162.1 Beta-N-acetylhexosaminidase [Microbacterium sp. TNHR37B]